MSVTLLPEAATQVFIALGSNLENPSAQVERGVQLLDGLEHTSLLKRSSLYRSAPVGKIDQPDFINAVVQIQTYLAPHDLLAALLSIERDAGRIRTYPNAPRILDLDILLFGTLQCCDTELILPHPRMHERAFVLQPLLEITGECYISGHGSATNCLAACADQLLERIDPS